MIINFSLNKYIELESLYYAIFIHIFSCYYLEINIGGNIMKPLLNFDFEKEGIKLSAP